MTTEELIEQALSMHETNVDFVKSGAGQYFPATVMLCREQGSTLAVLDVTMMDDDLSKTLIGLKVRHSIQRDPTIEAVLFSADGFRTNMTREFVEAMQATYGHIPPTQELEKLGLVSRSEAYTSHLEIRSTGEMVTINTGYGRAVRAKGPITRWDEVVVERDGTPTRGRLSGFFLDGKVAEHDIVGGHE